MKQIFAIASLLLVGSFSFASSISGFYDNGFQHSDSACYHGKVEDVCALMAQEEETQKASYSEGEHGYFEIQSCDVQGQEATVKYQRITDYDGTEGAAPLTTLVIGRCN